MSVPDSLTHKQELFASSGRIGRDVDDLFREASWVQVMLGQGVTPVSHDPMADALSEPQLDEFLGNVRTLIERAVDGLPTHEQFLKEHCAST
jgi:tryptophan halogenase